MAANISTWQKALKRHCRQLCEAASKTSSMKFRTSAEEKEAVQRFIT